MKIYFANSKNILLWLLFFLLFVSTVQSQSTHLKKITDEISPSPTSSNLGQFGGIDIKKSTGAINKSIEIFNLTQRDLNYKASIHYNSTGIKVNDWGSRIGIGWKENLYSIITRTVRGKPDERVSNRTGDGRYEFGDPSSPDYSIGSYQKITSLSLNNSSIDGEYDIFNFKIDDIYGEFFIRNGQAIILSNDYDLKIDIVESAPTFKFIVYKSNGEKYYFDSYIETTQYNNENACQIDNQSSYYYVPTAWFVSKVSSVNGSNYFYEYEPREYSYIFDFTESYEYSDDFLVFIDCDENLEYPQNGFQTICLRKKDTNTFVLKSIKADNFELNFQYGFRQDLWGDGLLKKIILSNASGIQKTYEFSYDSSIATTPFELNLNANLSDDLVEKNGLRVRYFLKELLVRDNLENIDHSYSFSYINPSILPHRFSFSQDLYGCFNDKNNSGMVPFEAIDELENLNISIPTANRNPDLLGSSGLLNTVHYPTGGIDSIFYGQNTYQKAQIIDHWDWYTENRVCNGDQLEEDFFLMTVPYELIRDGILTLTCYYDSNDPLPHPDAEYYAVVDLIEFSGDNQTIIPLSGRPTTGFTMYPHRDVNLRSYSGALSFRNNAYYMLRISLVGEHTALEAKFDYVYDTTIENINKPYFGFRVNKVKSVVNSNNTINKNYSYNYFKKEGDQLIISDSSSLSIAPFDFFKFVAKGVFECVKSTNHGRRHVIYPTYKLLSNSNYNIGIYQGEPFIYSHITEFIDSSKTSFISSRFSIDGNTKGGKLMGGERFTFTVEPVFPAMENSGWICGLEDSRYYGEIIGDHAKILKELEWSYSNEPEIFYNYSAVKLKEIFEYKDIEFNISEYLLSVYNIFKHHIKLDSINEIEYFRTNGLGYSTLRNKTKFKYSIGDHFIEEVHNSDSRGRIVSKFIYRPKSLILQNRDPEGIYLGMVSKNQISPEIEVISKINNNQISLFRTNYYQPYTGLFLPKLIQSQKGINDPLKNEVHFLKYDSVGNILSLSEDSGLVINFIWSYLNNYPVAKIINCNYTDIENILGYNQIFEFGRLSPSLEELDLFIGPISSNLNSAEVTKYIYLPPIGIISKVDVSGKKFFFSYDALGRIKFFADNFGNILKAIDYKYFFNP